MTISHEHLMWSCSVVTFGMAVPWFFVEAGMLRRKLREGRATHDDKFGAAVGMLISIIGAAGVLKYHLGG